jgi:hypothetical protein
MQYERQVVQLFAYGTGRGAAEESEKVYGSGSNVGKPLAGAFNRCVKIAEKRTEVDAVIRTFGLDFRQDEEYGDDGKLKGDKRGKNTDPEGKAFFSQIMTLVNLKEQKEDLFTVEEKKNHVASAKAIENNLQALKDFYSEIKKVADARISARRSKE